MAHHHKLAQDFYYIVAALCNRPFLLALTSRGCEAACSAVGRDELCVYSGRQYPNSAAAAARQPLLLLLDGQKLYIEELYKRKKVGQKKLLYLLSMCVCILPAVY